MPRTNQNGSFEYSECPKIGHLNTYLTHSITGHICVQFSNVLLAPYLQSSFQIFCQPRPFDKEAIFSVMYETVWPSRRFKNWTNAQFFNGYLILSHLKTGPDFSAKLDHFICKEKIINVKNRTNLSFFNGLIFGRPLPFEIWTSPVFGRSLYLISLVFGRSLYLSLDIECCTDIVS
jgi:hypothetical protein